MTNLLFNDCYFQAEKTMKETVFTFEALSVGFQNVLAEIILVLKRGVEYLQLNHPPTGMLGKLVFWFYYLTTVTDVLNSLTTFRNSLRLCN